MSNVFYVESTDGTLTITLKPGTLNGPGGPNRDTDMRLYGMGALLWGEGVDENILRLTETFACDEKAGTPGVPRDEVDYGVSGYGITTPVTGQQWFNKTDGLLYLYDGTSWGRVQGGLPVGDNPPASANMGDLWYDTLTTGECALPTIKFYDPTHPNALISGWVKIGNDRVSVCGDNMSGILNMTGDGGTTRHRITNLGDPIDPYDAVHRQFFLDELGTFASDLTAHVADGTMHLDTWSYDLLQGAQGCAPDAALMASDLCALYGYTNSPTPGGTIYNDINDKLSKSGGAASTMSTNQTITLGRDPVAPMEAVTLQYFENETGAAIGAQRFVSFFNTLAVNASFQPQEGDIASVSDGRVYVRVQGNWRQIYPAQYTP